MKIPFGDYLLKIIPLKYYGMLDASVVPQTFVSVKPE